MFRFRIVPQLTERHAKLGDPPFFVDSRFDIPYAIPRRVFDNVGVDGIVAFHTSRIDGQLYAGAAVVKRVDNDLNLVARCFYVAAAEQWTDAVRMGIVGPYKHVQVMIVVGDPHLGSIRGREVFTGIELTEVGHRWREHPDGIIAPTVDHWRRGGAYGMRNGFVCSQTLSKQRRRQHQSGGGRN